MGTPDPARTEIVKAYIVLNEGFEDSDALRAEIAQQISKRRPSRGLGGWGGRRSGSGLRSRP